jgi:protein-disulfide isomerase
MDNLLKSTKRERWEKRQEEKRQFKEGARRARVIYKWLKRIGIVAIFGAVIFFYNTSRPATSNDELLAVKADDWIKGSSNPKVTLIEYLDFECESCGAYYPVMKKLSEEFGNEVRFIVRYFPLDGHKNSMTSALAAEAAGNQGKFWEMHDKLFENQRSWGESRTSKADEFEKYAEDLGLDMTKFGKDVRDKDLKSRIARDRSSGINLGIQGTPTFFLDGKKIKNPRGYEEFKALLQQATEKLNKQ